MLHRAVDMDVDSTTRRPLDDSNFDEPFERPRFLEWLVWTLAPSIPVFSAAAWLTVALRRRNYSLLFETVVAGIWPLAGVFILLATSAMFGFVDALLFSQFDGEWLAYRAESDALMEYHPSYQWVGTAEQLDEIDSMEYAFTGMNQGLERHQLFTGIALLLSLIGCPAMWIASIVHAQRLWRRDFDSDRETRHENPEKLRLSVFGLWVLLGWTGAHRLYVGRWVSGIVYFFTLGGLGIGWAVDLFVLRVLVDDANQMPRQPNRIAPWAEETRYGLGDFLARWVFFAAGTSVFVGLCMLVYQYELLLVLLFTLVVCGLFGNFQRLIDRFKILEKIPFARPTIAVIRQLHEFYYETQPRSFWFYLLGPIFAPIELMRSTSFRDETKLYFRFFLAILGAALINQVRLIPTTYRYHSLGSIAGWMLLHVVAALIVSWVVLTPILTTAFTFNLSGKHRRLRVLSLTALIVAFVTGLSVIGYTTIRQRPTMISHAMISTRLRDVAFQKRLTESTRLFLEHYVERTPKPLDDFYPMASHPLLTHRYQVDVLSVFAPANEAKVFRVFTIDSEGDEPDGAWLGVGIHLYEDSDSGWRTLFMMGPDKVMHSAWEADMDPRVAEEFALASSLWNSQYEHRIARRNPETDRALYQAAEQFLRAEQAQHRHDSRGKSGTSVARFDPLASRMLRDKLVPEWGDDVLRFRVFRLPPDSPEGCWLGVTDGDEPLCLLAPWGDLFRAWDHEVFARFRTVTRQFERLKAARREPRTVELFTDIQTARARRFLLQYQGTESASIEALSQRVGAFIDRESHGKDVWSMRELQGDGERWRAVVDRAGPRYLMGDDRKFYIRRPTGFADLTGHSPPPLVAFWAGDANRVRNVSRRNRPPLRR